MIDFILNLLFIIFVIFIAIILTSKGECYYCGYKFKGTDKLIGRKNGKKQCDTCWLNDIE